MSCRKSCLPKDDWKIVWKFFPVDDYKPEASTTSTSIVEKRWESPIILDCIDDQSLSTAVVDSIAKDHKMATTTTISLFFARSSFSLSHTLLLGKQRQQRKEFRMMVGGSSACGQCLSSPFFLCVGDSRKLDDRNVYKRKEKEINTAHQLNFYNNRSRNRHTCFCRTVLPLVFFE